MLNVYKFHSEPTTLIQQGQQASLEEVYNYTHPFLEQYVFYFNEDPDNEGDHATISTTTSDNDTYQTVLQFMRNGETFKRITLNIVQREHGIVITGRNANIYSNKPFVRSIRAHEHGLLDEEAVNDFLEDLLHHF